MQQQGSLYQKSILGTSFNQVSIFTDQNGPYFNAPENIKNILDQIRNGQKLNFNKLDLSHLKFKSNKQQLTNFCPRNSKYFKTTYCLCTNCSVWHPRGGLGDHPTVFCLSCYKQQKHVGHGYVEYETNLCQFHCYCGTKDRINEDYFCQKHRNYDQQLEIKTNEEKRKQFMDCFVSIIQCSLYMYPFQSQVFDKIQKYLINLNISSIYYIRLVFQLLNMTSSSKKIQYKNKKYFTLFLNNKNKYLFFSLGQDLRTRKSLTKLLLSLSSKQNIVEEILKITINTTVIEHLIREGFENQRLDRIILDSYKNKIKRQCLYLFYESKINSSKNQLQLIQKDLNFIDARNSINLLKKIINYYPFNQNILQSKHITEDQRQGIKQKLSILIIKSFAILVLTYAQKSINIRQKLLQAQISQQNIQNIIIFITQKPQYLVIQSGFNHQLYIITILVLIRQSKIKNKIIEKIWYNIFQMVNKLEEGNKFIYIFRIFYYYICFIHQIQITMAIEYKQFLDQCFQPTSQIQSKLYQWFKCLLTRQKKISITQIISLKNKGMLNFPQAAKLLNQSCHYDNKHRIFYYKGQQNKKTRINQLPIMGSKNDWETLNVKFGDKKLFQEGSFGEILIKQLLSTGMFVSYLDKLWGQKIIKKQNSRQDQNMSGYIYLLLLVIFDNLTDSNNKQLGKRLQELKNKQSLSQYSNSSIQLSLIKKILGIQSYTQQIQKEQNMEQQNQVRNNCQIINQNKKQQYHNNNQHCVKCNTGNSSTQLYYIGIIKQQFYCNIFFPNNHIENMSLYTCFHKIHLNCYQHLITDKKRNYICPLCKQKRNCIFPIKPCFKQQKKKITICQNIIKGVLFMSNQNYNIDHLFVIIFKHLLQSHGFNLILFPRQKTQQINKNDKFFMDFILQIYKNNQKQSYLQDIKALIHQAKQFNKPQCRILQLLTIYSLKQIITQKDQSQQIKKLFDQGYFNIQKNKFQVIINNIAKIRGKDDYIMPISIENEISVKKADFSLSYILPQRASQFCIKYKTNQRKPCDYHNINKQHHQLRSFICLICAEMVCQNCRYDHSIRHKNINFYMDIVTLKVQLSSNNPDVPIVSQAVYMNQYCIEYDERLRDQLAVFRNDEFYLNKKKFQEIISKAMFY